MTVPAGPRIVGVVLAAGSGSRYGGPKALALTATGVSFLQLAVASLDPADCTMVILGAAAESATPLVPDGVIVVHHPDHSAGMASSLLVALTALPPDTDAVLVTLVDLPGVTAAMTARVIEAAGAERAAARTALVRATFAGVPGHPALIGVEHVPALTASLLTGDPDRGAGPYLHARQAVTVECGDLGDGSDVDTPRG